MVRVDGGGMTALSIDGIFFDAKSITSNGLQLWAAPAEARRQLRLCAGRSVPMSWAGKSGRICHAVVRLTGVVGVGAAGGRQYVSVNYVRAIK